ncbi:HAMP domain-containing protein [Virgibacillus halophilus]|uniref:histidine kinase n=1 Tax=Tigheibacillus halophilus TaxID=361280 RepID=A0ABU5C6Q6_9BACI|nr:HAMP domain-containing protein [Virgibacillus halophilus]
MAKLLGRVPFMRTLYVRMIAIIITILLASASIAFVGSNIYYHYFLKPENDAKITHIAKQTVAIYEEGKNEDIDTYLSTLTALGYQFYLADETGKGRFFGARFRKENIKQADVHKVLEGRTYHGIGKYPWKLFVTGFFDNELRNTIGVPVQVDGQREALFVRPNTVVQFGEMRIFLAVLLAAVLLLSFLLVIISMSFIVKPIKKLTEATKKIAEGNYRLKLNEKRKDEIGRLASNFTRMSESLKNTEEKRQEFVSNVSHEIQSPPYIHTRLFPSIARR